MQISKENKKINGPIKNISIPKAGESKKLECVSYDYAYIKIKKLEK